MWSVPDPVDPNYIWADLEDGALTDLQSQRRSVARFIRPYDAFPGSFLGPFDLSKVPRIVSTGIRRSRLPRGTVISRGSAVTSSSKRSIAARHWTAISPDLTRNIKEHQQPSGGPLAKDVSGAEYSDTLLYIEGSATQSRRDLGRNRRRPRADDARCFDGPGSLEQRHAARYAGVRAHGNGRAVAAGRRHRLRVRRQPSHAVTMRLMFSSRTTTATTWTKIVDGSAGRSVRTHASSRYA